MARETSIARPGFGRIERRESGRYRAAYTGPDGRLYRAPTTFDAREDAVAWPANRRAEIQMESRRPTAQHAAHRGGRYQRCARWPTASMKWSSATARVERDSNMSREFIYTGTYKVRDGRFEDAREEARGAHRVHRGERAAPDRLPCLHQTSQLGRCRSCRSTATLSRWSAT